MYSTICKSGFYKDQFNLFQDNLRRGLSCLQCRCPALNRYFKPLLGYSWKQKALLNSFFYRQIYINSHNIFQCLSISNKNVTKGYRWCNLTAFVKGISKTHAESYTGKHVWRINACGKTSETLLLSLSFFLQFSSVQENALFGISK